MSTKARATMGHGGGLLRPSGHGYVVSRPPRGLFIRGGLPLGFASLVVAGLTYYTLAGIFYRPEPDGYVVVDAPAGVVVNSPPPQIVAPSEPQGNGDGDLSPAKRSLPAPAATTR